GSVGRTNRGRIGDRCELDQPHAIGIAVEEIGGEVQGQTGFSAASRTGQRQETGRLQKRHGSRELTRSTNKGRRLRREIVWRGIKTPNRGEAVRKPIDQQLIEALWREHGLSPWLA